MKIGIGIDTGGTYTDAVIYDFDSGSILGSAKSLTTREDLTIGILGALDALPPHLVRSAGVVSLSTTLATNACVEDKGGRAKLIFFGADLRVLNKHGAKYGLPPAPEILIPPCETRFSGEILREPDWDAFAESLRTGFENLDGVGIVEVNAMKNGAAIEKKAKEIAERVLGVPAVCGHELFSELNCLQRAASTLLNARLFPVIKEFLDAIKEAMARRGVHAAVVIVRSDGSLMSEEFASFRPVETLLCGPAASVIGGHRLTEEKNSVIIDMGGTTTDIAMLREGVPVSVVDGIRIGKWKTFVDGLYVRTFGLGGDSAVHYQDKCLKLEDYRIVPLCAAAARDPGVVPALQNLLEETERHTMFLYEHFLLVRDISGSPRYTEEEKRFCARLQNGPLMLKAAAEAAGTDIYNLKIQRLLRDGVVQRCGLTPTDIMHIRGDFSRFDKTASLLAAEFAARNMEISVEELCVRVYDEINRRIYVNVVKALLENKEPAYLRNGISGDVERFILQSYEAAKTDAADPLLHMPFKTDFSLLGIGAPIHIFLPEVARMLGTRAVIPEYSGVANALGAVAGNVNVTQRVEIRPNNTVEGITGYTVYAAGGSQTFEELQDAEAFALREALEAARQEAVLRGAQGEISVSGSLTTEEAEGRDCTIYLGSAAVAQAVGSLGF